MTFFFFLDTRPRHAPPLPEAERGAPPPPPHTARTQHTRAWRSLPTRARLLCASSERPAPARAALRSSVGAGGRAAHMAPPPPPPSAAAPIEKGAPWSEEEHLAFLDGLSALGKGQVGFFFFFFFFCTTRRRGVSKGACLGAARGLSRFRRPGWWGRRRVGSPAGCVGRGGVGWTCLVTSTAHTQKCAKIACERVRVRVSRLRAPPAR